LKLLFKPFLGGVPRFRDGLGGGTVIQRPFPFPLSFRFSMNKERLIPLIVATALFMEVGVIR
jgi:hypothetical protein